MLGKNVEAKEDYNTALQIDPNDAKIYISRGDIFKRVDKDIPKAIEDYTRAITVDPLNIVAYESRAYAYEWIGDLDKALADCEQILRIDSSWLDSHLLIAYFLFTHDQVEEAIARLYRYLEEGGDEEMGQDDIAAYQRVLRRKAYIKRWKGKLRRWRQFG